MWWGVMFPGIPSSTGPKSRRNKSTPTSRASSITSLVFQDQYHLISCGAGDGLVHFPYLDGYELHVSGLEI